MAKSFSVFPCRFLDSKREALAELIDSRNLRDAVYLKNLRLGVADSQNLRRQLRETGNSVSCCKTLIKKPLKKSFP